VGYLFSLYYNSKVEENKRVDARAFMPHEDQPKEMSLEEYMMQSFGGS